MSEIFDHVCFRSLENDWKRCKDIIMALEFPNKWYYETEEGDREYFSYDVDDDYHFALCPDGIFVWCLLDDEMQMAIENFNLDDFKKQVMTTFPDLKWPC